MVVFPGSHQKDDLNEWIKRLNRLPGKIGLRFKMKLVGAQFHFCAFFHQVGNPSILIGGPFCYLYPFPVFVLAQNNVQSHGRFTFRGIEDVCSQLAHLN